MKTMNLQTKMKESKLECHESETGTSGPRKATQRARESPAESYLGNPKLREEPESVQKPKSLHASSLEDPEPEQRQSVNPGPCSAVAIADPELESKHACAISCAESYLGDSTMHAPIPDDVKLQPPHANLVKQPRSSNLCVLYAILNSFETMEEVCQFLNIPKRAKLKAGDTDFVVNFMRDKLNIKSKKKGMTSANVSDLLRNKEFQEAVGIKSYVWKGTQMDLQHILTSEREECNQRYMCFGYQFKEKERSKGVRIITESIGKLGSEEETEEEEPGESEEGSTAAGQKRKAPAKAKGPKKRPKSGMTAAEGRLPVTEEIREELEKGIEKHSRTVYRGANMRHATLIYFNKYGVPFRYDPGVDQVVALLPGDKDDQFTRADMRRGVELFCTSMLQLGKVYLLKIELEPRGCRK